jgi:hypothetical protein
LPPDLPRNTCDVRHAKSRYQVCATFQWRGCTRGGAAIRHAGNPVLATRHHRALAADAPFSRITCKAFCLVR